jgi:hypothetical protein
VKYLPMAVSLALLHAGEAQTEMAFATRLEKEE